jgi:hypothetical protein
MGMGSLAPDAVWEYGAAIGHGDWPAANQINATAVEGRAHLTCRRYVQVLHQTTNRGRYG